jgi:hypothetical protein
MSSGLRARTFSSRSIPQAWVLLWFAYQSRRTSNVEGLAIMGKKSSKVKSKRVGADDFVLTPGGWRPKSKTFKLEPGHHVDLQGGTLRVVRTATGAVVADLGPISRGSAASGRPGSPRRKTSAKRKR